jgi:hypothetical protein
MFLQKKMLILVVLALTVAGENLVTAQDIQAIPKSISISNGELLVRFDKQKLWTMNRIEFQGKLLGIDSRSSHYGTVFKFPGVGFIGTGHTENESEQLIKLDFYVNDKRIKELPEDGKLNVTSFKMVRHSIIRNFRLKNTIAVKQNIISETVVIMSSKDVALDLIYNFMHPWLPTMSDYLVKTTNGTMISGTFSTSKKMFVNSAIDWVAVYHAQSELGTVSRMIKQPDKGGAIAMLWDEVPYRKFYLKSFAGKTFPRDYIATYRIVTGFFKADKNSWQQLAGKIAQKLN